MLLAEVRKIIGDTNLNFNPATVSEVAKFLEQHIGNNCLDRFDYEVLASAAIVCEVSRVPDLTSKLAARTGIYVETVMRHLDKRSKEEFL
jgi:hypothetical protein